MARDLAAEWPPLAEELARRYWPGPLTLVIAEIAPRFPISSPPDLPTVGLRMPDHPSRWQLIEAAGVPIAAPSANRFTAPFAHHAPSTCARTLATPWKFWMADPSRVGIESTVVSLAGGKLTLLRPGMISLGEIETPRLRPSRHRILRPECTLGTTARARRCCW